MLADDTNQDLMRSLISVFRPLRTFAAELDPWLKFEVKWAIGGGYGSYIKITSQSEDAS